MLKPCMSTRCFMGCRGKKYVSKSPEDTVVFITLDNDLNSVMELFSQSGQRWTIKVMYQHHVPWGCLIRMDLSKNTKMIYHKEKMTLDIKMSSHYECVTKMYDSGPCYKTVERPNNVPVAKEWLWFRVLSFRYQFDICILVYRNVFWKSWMRAKNKDIYFIGRDVIGVRMLSVAGLLCDIQATEKQQQWKSMDPLHTPPFYFQEFINAKKRKVTGNTLNKTVTASWENKQQRSYKTTGCYIQHLITKASRPF